MPRFPGVFVSFAGPVLVACVAPAERGPDTDSDTDPPEEAATATWMGREIPPGEDDIALRDLLLPGTFNSSSYACAEANGMSPDAPDIVKLLWENLEPGSGGTGLNRERIVGWSKTQDRSLREQLRDGIRSLDINLTRKDDRLVTWHSVYGEPLDDALDQVVDFAASHPSEVVLLSFGLTLDEADWPAFADALTAPRVDGISLCDLLFTGPEPSNTATLAAVRASGRNLIWAPGGDLATLFDARGDCPTAALSIEVRGSESTTPEGVIARLEETVATRAPDVFLKNDFFFYLGQAETDAKQASFLAEYASMADALDALGFSGAFPGELIERFDTEGKMNVFTGGYYERTNLVEAVIERTGTR